MISTELTGGWTLRATGGDRAGQLPEEIPATVPGSSHLDLLAAGLIGDPFLDDNEIELNWLFDLDWRYRTVLEPDDDDDLSAPGRDERVDLVFDGIDTLATVSLGGTELGRTANMHRSYRFDVGRLLTGDRLELIVDLDSATRFAEAERQRLGPRPASYGTPFNYVRKMACSFGWDWGPDLRTAGIWQGVRLERWRTARLASVRPWITVDANGTGQVDLQVDLERTTSWGGLTLTAEILGSRAQLDVAGSATGVVLHLEVPDAPLWWPAGYGEPRLADLVLTVSQEGELLDRWQRRLGFRTVDLDTSADQHGSAFTFRVNGTPIFVKGANWIPDDHFLTRVTAARLARRLDQALAANVNLLRVWGGGIYETDDFYTACDERGLLVWQDFLLACAAYPEEEPLWHEIHAEARENVVRLMPHASLIHWNGGNENLWGYQDWGWPEQLQGRTWGERYAREVFPAILAELDPTRTYSENSPCSPGPADPVVHPNDPDIGSHHQWEVWNQIDYTAYRNEIPRFCSEFGFQGPPTWRTLQDWVHNAAGGPLEDSPSPKEDATFSIHQKAADGNAKVDRGLAPHLGVPADFADWHWAAQLNQARAVAYAIDHYRSWWPRTAGAIVWQLNDCWPVTSWAAIDSEERCKPLWYALRSAFASKLLAFVDRGGALTVAAVNDTSSVWSGQLELTRQRLAGGELAGERLAVSVAPRSVTLIPVPHGLSTPEDGSTEILLARLDDVSRVHAFVEDVDLALDPDPVSATVTAIPGGYRVDVLARALARDVALLADIAAADAVVDDGLVTLLAGERTVFEVRTAVDGIEGTLAARPVLRSANDLRRADRTVGS
jgi:beta-mannosidase